MSSIESKVVEPTFNILVIGRAQTTTSTWVDETNISNSVQLIQRTYCGWVRISEQFNCLKASDNIIEYFTIMKPINYSNLVILFHWNWNIVSKKLDSTSCLGDGCEDVPFLYKGLLD